MVASQDPSKLPPHTHFGTTPGVEPAKLHGKTIYEWSALGLFTMKDIMEYAEKEIGQLNLYFDEDRVDIIGSNGNEGLHYEGK